MIHRKYVTLKSLTRTESLLNFRHSKTSSTKTSPSVTSKSMTPSLSTNSAAPKTIANLTETVRSTPTRHLLQAWVILISMRSIVRILSYLRRQINPSTCFSRICTRKTCPTQRLQPRSSSNSESTWTRHVTISSNLSSVKETGVYYRSCSRDRLHLRKVMPNLGQRTEKMTSMSRLRVLWPIQVWRYSSIKVIIEVFSCSRWEVEMFRLVQLWIAWGLQLIWLAQERFLKIPRFCKILPRLASMIFMELKAGLWLNPCIRFLGKWPEFKMLITPH